MSVTIINNFRCESCDGPQPVTRAEFQALENQMSILSDKIAEVTASIEAVKARVETAVPTQADLDALDAAKASLDAIVPAPVVPPPVETPVEVPPTV